MFIREIRLHHAASIAMGAFAALALSACGGGSSSSGSGGGSSSSSSITPTETILWSFGASGDGQSPYAGLMSDASGNLYGTTEGGGTKGQGTVFELVKGAGGYTESVLYSFGSSGSADGKSPYAGLISDASGNLYGTTYGGGANGTGTVFKLTKGAGGYTENVLYSFGLTNGTDAQNPDGGLILDGSGNLYGTTYGGGANGTGTVFELTYGGPLVYNETVLYSFGSLNTVDAQNPADSLISDINGNLYGTTQYGGANGSGAVFELVKGASFYSETVLHSFGSGTDGQDPYASLILDAGSNLYGTTQYGGANNNGVVFELVNSGGGAYTETVLYSFGPTGGGDALNPSVGLISDVNGNLYGTTAGGGTNNTGTVFKLTKGAGGYTENVLYSFGSGGTAAANPEASLIADASGNLYSTTFAGGSNGTGTVFEVTP